MDNRKETAEKIITALTNRSGFNDLWYNLDEEIQTEITDEVVNILPIHCCVAKRTLKIMDYKITYNNQTKHIKRFSMEMQNLKVKSIHFDSDGVLKIQTNISDKLKLAKYVSKDKMEKVLNSHPLEMHIYQKEFMISSICFMGQYVSFDVREFIEFLEQKQPNKTH